MANLLNRLVNTYHQLTNRAKQEYWEKKRTLHGRFFLYLFIIFGSIFSALGLLLFGTGLLNPVDHELSNFMDNDLEVRSKELSRYYDNLAAHNVVFSQQLTESTMQTLRKNNATLADLNNNPQLLRAVQRANFDIVENNLRQNSCSGVLYLLKASVNTKLPHKTYSGIYLKYAYLYSENMPMNDWFMFRGDYQVAHERNLELFNTWQLELDVNAFPEADDVLKVKDESLAKSFLLTKTTRLADTWEKVRLLLLPIYDGEGRNIGMCGYEVSSVYYQLRSQPIYYKDRLVLSGVIDDDGTNHFVGQFNNDGAAGDSPFTMEQDGEYVLLHNDMGTFIGKALTIELGNKKHLLVTMMPKAIYDELMQTERLKIAMVLAALLVLFAGAYYFFAYHYLNPLVRDLRRLTEKENLEYDPDFAEIDDVFTTWQNNTKEQNERLAQQQAMLEKMDAERNAARNEYESTAANLATINEQQTALMQRYQQLLDELAEREDELRRLQEQKKAAQEQYQSAKTSLNNVLQKQWEEIDQDEYQMFVSGIALLTPKEREVFDMYCKGLSTKEIVARLCVSDNTVKFHNRNIYSKLGIRSRKELLRNIEFWNNQNQNT